jgi:Secretion system C-terminal sorting domain
VVSSLESNSKIASPSGYETEHQIEQLTNLDYMIRFRNVGNDTAFNVIVKDTLSNFLEPTSIEFGASSHPYTIEWQENNIVKFIFKNILLTDSITNGAASLGFLKFRVSQKPNLPSGTKIFNKAALYFDFNAPRSTSQTFHTVGKNFMVTASTDLTLPNGRNIKVYPNPFTEQAVFEIEGDPLSTKSIFKLYDMMGRLLRIEQFDTNQYPFLRKDLTGGIYLFTIENDKKVIGRGKLMVQ